MTDLDQPQVAHIPFREELVRKLAHISSLVLPVSYWTLGLSKGEMLTILVPIFFLMLLVDVARLYKWPFWKKVAKPIFGRMIRRHEKDGEFTGATYILLSACCVVALFSKPIAIASLAFIIIGDPAAALIGRTVGRIRIGSKTVEGSLGCLVGTLLVAFVAPKLPLAVGLTGAFVATIFEALPLRIDDNISVPLASGCVMTLVSYFLTIS